MKASKIRSFWITIQSVALILYYSVKIILLYVLGLSNRKTIDLIAQQLSKKLLNTINLKYAIINSERLHFDKNRRYIIMCNHSSLYDIPLSTIAINGSLRMITKKELFRVPIWGQAMKISEFIPIDRENAAAAKKNLEYAKQKLESGIIAWIAPEGTRSRLGKLLPFKKGGFLLALQTEAIIIPLGIRGAFNILPPKTFDFHIGEHAEIHIGTPIDTRNYKIAERKLLMNEVEKSIRELAGL